MNLLDTPHCRKHEVYTQKCIGCRIKATQSHGRHDMITQDPEAKQRLLESSIANIDTKPDHTTELKQLLKAIYTAGLYGAPRNLNRDIETLKGLL